MAFEHNENSGSLFRNERKTQEKQPDHTGSGLVKCPHCDKTGLFRLSAWIKTAGGSGKKFFSLAFTPADEIGNSAPKPATEFSDEDIPF